MWPRHAFNHTAIEFLPLFPSTVSKKRLWPAFVFKAKFSLVLLFSLLAVLLLFSPPSWYFSHFFPFPSHSLSASLFFHLDSLLKKKSIKFHKTPLYFTPHTWSSTAVSVPRVCETQCIGPKRGRNCCIRSILYAQNMSMCELTWRHECLPARRQASMIISDFLCRNDSQALCFPSS